MSDTTRLYRTVSIPEFDDLRLSGVFRFAGGAEGKYFWESQSDAARFGRDTQDHYHPEGYRIVAADFPRVVADRLFRFARLDGVGPARFADLDDLAHGLIVFLDTP